MKSCIALVGSLVLLTTSGWALACQTEEAEVIGKVAELVEATDSSCLVKLKLSSVKLSQLCPDTELSVGREFSFRFKKGSQSCPAADSQVSGYSQKSSAPGSTRSLESASW